jgi:hypothetical protein
VGNSREAMLPLRERYVSSHQAATRRPFVRRKERKQPHHLAKPEYLECWMVLTPNSSSGQWQCCRAGLSRNDHLAGTEDIPGLEIVDMGTNKDGKDSKDSGMRQLHGRGPPKLNRVASAPTAIQSYTKAYYTNIRDSELTPELSCFAAFPSQSPPRHRHHHPPLQSL